jgi:biotin synthase
MQRREIFDWLRETSPARLAELWQLADRVRQENVGGEVHLRGLIELSNHCVRLCGYCGLRAGNFGLERYRMSDDEIMACVRKAVEFGYGTVVLQSGEDPELTCDRMAQLVRRIKAETPLAVTLSLGERADEELAAWRQAGADRYLLRFETSNRNLYEQIHPPRTPHAPREGSSAQPHAEREEHDRLAILATLRRLGYEVGSGVMIGIPGQTYDDLADDIELFARLGLDMIGVGPYLRHPETPLASYEVRPDAANGQQVPASEEMTYKVIALARLVCPRANIPATTALATLNTHEGRELGLVRGANVVMPNLTPPKYRVLYEIYPNKACIAETGEACHYCLDARIEAIGRRPGQGRGDSANYVQPASAARVRKSGLRIEE